MTVSKNKFTIKRIGESDRLEILNQPNFLLRAYNSHGRKVLTLDAERLLMENVSTYLPYYSEILFLLYCTLYQFQQMNNISKIFEEELFKIHV